MCKVGGIYFRPSVSSVRHAIHALSLDPLRVLTRLAVSSFSNVHGVDVQREVLDSGLSSMYETKEKL
jgi:hypothetical protein